MFKTVAFLLAVTVIASAQDSALPATPNQAEGQIWNLEKAYWEYVKHNDLEKYRALWHEDFIGWPFVSSEPVHKNQITDWITANTSKGLNLQSYSIEQLDIGVTGDVAIDHYRVKITWADNKGAHARTDVMRITHTWIHKHDAWEIIGGMSAPVNAQGK